MKRIFFVLTILTLSLFPDCKAVNPEVSATEVTKQFGYYVAHGDAVKAELNVVYTSEQRNNLSTHINSVKSEIENAGGLKQIVVEGEQVIVAGEQTIVTIVWECQDGKRIKQAYTLIVVDNSWRIDMGQL